MIWTGLTRLDMTRIGFRGTPGRYDDSARAVISLNGDCGAGYSLKLVSQEH